MAPPAAAGRQAPPPRRRLLSIGVQAAALALFLLFAAAATILLVYLVVATRVFRHQHHHGGSRYRVLTASTTSPPPPHPRHGLSPADLRLLPCFAASPRDDPSSSSPRLCPVCLEAAQAGELWRALPSCGHAFHAACVDRWLARSPACPVCRAAVAFSVS